MPLGCIHSLPCTGVATLGHLVHHVCFALPMAHNDKVHGKVGERRHGSEESCVLRGCLFPVLLWRCRVALAASSPRLLVQNTATSLVLIDCMCSIPHRNLFKRSTTNYLYTHWNPRTQRLSVRKAASVRLWVLASSASRQSAHQTCHSRLGRSHRTHVTKPRQLTRS